MPEAVTIDLTIRVITEEDIKMITNRIIMRIQEVGMVEAEEEGSMFEYFIWVTTKIMGSIVS